MSGEERGPIPDDLRADLARVLTDSFPEVAPERRAMALFDLRGALENHLGDMSDEHLDPVAQFLVWLEEKGYKITKLAYWAKMPGVDIVASDQLLEEYRS